MSKKSEIAKLREKILLEPDLLGRWLGYEDLTEKHGEMIKWIWGENHKEDALLLAHRGSYKTTSIVVVGMIWYLMFHPNETILLVRKEYSGAAAVLSQIRSLYKSDKMVALYDKMGIYAEIDKPVKMPLLEVDREDTITLITKKQITTEGNIEITGINSKGVTGRHYHRIHLDDAVVDVDKSSKVQRKNTKDVFENLKSVINPGNAMTLTGTPWHPNDLYSTIDNRKYYPIGTIKIKGFDSDEIDKKRRELLPSVYASQYDLKFIPEDGKLFADVKMADNVGHINKTRGHIDPAFGGDNTSALTIAFYEYEKITVLGKIYTGHIRNSYDKIAKLIKEYRVKPVYVENNGDKGATCLSLQSEYGISAMGYHESSNKHIKISTHLYKSWHNIYFHKDTDQEYIEQIQDYQEGADSDDAPDSLASLLLRFTFRKKIREKHWSAEHYGGLKPQEKEHWAYDLM